MRVPLKLYDVLGGAVEILDEGNVLQASQPNTSSYASGTYYYRLEAGKYVVTRRMMILK